MSLFQLDIYQPAKDIYVQIANAHKRSRAKDRHRRIRQNIADLSPAIHSDGWTFRFVEEDGESLNLINDEKLLNDTAYAKELLNFATAMELPGDDANPSVVKATDVYNSSRVNLKELNVRLCQAAKRVFRMMNLDKRSLHALCAEFHGENTIKRASEIIDFKPSMDAKRCNRYRWDMHDLAKLGTITNWLGDRVALTCEDLARLQDNLALPPFRLRKKKLSLDERKFVYELMLAVQHAFDTVIYLQDTLCCDQVIDISHVRYVYHDNGYIPDTLTNVQAHVNDLSYNVLLPLFFTKELIVRRSILLAKLRRRIVKFREKQHRVLTGDVIRDSRRMRGSDSRVAHEVREVASTVCVSDLLKNDDAHKFTTYGDFPRFRKEEVCGMPSGDVRIFCPSSVNYKVDHILNNFGTRLYRTRLDRCLRPNNDNIILAKGDVLATSALARQAVVYTNDPAWATDLVGSLEQPIIGGYHSSRHKLLAYLGLFHLFCVDMEEEAKMQDFLLQKSYSTDTDLLKKLVMEFVERRIIDRKNNEQDIKASEILVSAVFTSQNTMDSAVVAREMIHYLIADKGRLVPTVEEEDYDGCYFNALYNRDHGNARLVVNVTLPLAGLSTTQSNYFQLYTRDGQVLTSSVDLRTTRAEVVHLMEGGDPESFNAYPAVIKGDLSVA